MINIVAFVIGCAVSCAVPKKAPDFAFGMFAGILLFAFALFAESDNGIALAGCFLAGSVTLMVFRILSAPNQACS